MKLNKNKRIIILLIALITAGVFIFILFWPVDIKFNDRQIEKQVLETIGKQKGELIHRDDLSKVTELSISLDESDGDYRYLKNFSNLEYLRIDQATDPSIKLILDKCPNTLKNLSIGGGRYKMTIDDNILSKAEHVSIMSSSNVIDIAISESFESVCSELVVYSYSLLNVNNLGYLTDMKRISLHTTSGFDSALDCGFLANSPDISGFSIVDGKITNYEILESLESLEYLLLKDTGVENMDWAKKSDKLQTVVIQENGLNLIKKIADD